MVSLPLLISLLTLIDVTRSFEYFIDLERCKTKEMACYVRESCVKGPLPPTWDPSPSPTPKTSLRRITIEPLKGGTCDVIVQMKAFTDARYHIMIQVNATASSNSSLELDTDVGVSLVQNQAQINCSQSGIEGRIVLESYGTRQVYDKNLIFCSAILSDGTQKPIGEFFDVTYAMISPSIEFNSSMGTEAVIFAGLRKIFWNIPTVQCDDSMVATKNETTPEYLLYAIDKAYSTLSCPKPQRIRLYHDSIFYWPIAMECITPRWHYKLKENGVMTPIKFGDPFTAHCAIEFNELCAPLQSNSCRGCKPPQTTGKNNTFCPSDLWRMSDGSVVNTTVECKQIENERESGWFLEDGTQIERGACSTEFDCTTFSHLNLPDRTADYEKDTLSTDEKEITCPEGYNMSVSFKDDVRNVSSLTCNVKDGLFYVDKSSKDPVQRGSTVLCRKPPEPAPPDALAGASIQEIAGFAAGGLIGLVVIGAVGWFVVGRYRKKKRHQQYIKEKYADGMRTAREVDTNSEALEKDPSGRWTIRTFSSSEKQRMETLEQAPKPSPFNVHEPRTKWNAEVEPRVGEFVFWSANTFSKILNDFHLYSTENRLKCLRALTAFMHHSSLERVELKNKFWKKKKMEFGMISQFVEAIKQSHKKKLKCPETWDFFFRLLKIFIEHLNYDKLYKVQVRLKNVIRKIGNDIISDVGYRQKPDDTDVTGALRVIAVRFLLYLNEPNCTKEIEELAKLPIHEIESPLRMVVFSYMCNSHGESAIKEAFREEVNRQTKEPPRGVPNGTYRQHLIYALCSTRDAIYGPFVRFSTMREVLGELLNNKELVFTPTDMLYAFKGATEHRINFDLARDIFTLFAARYEFPDIQKIVYDRALTEEDQQLMTNRFKDNMVAMCHIMAENCINPTEFNALRESIAIFIEYAAPESFAKMEGREIEEEETGPPVKPMTEYEKWEESRLTKSMKEEIAEEQKKEHRMRIKIVQAEPDAINVDRLSERARQVRDLISGKRKDLKGESGIYFMFHKALTSTTIMAYDDVNVYNYNA